MPVKSIPTDHTPRGPFVGSLMPLRYVRAQANRYWTALGGSASIAELDAAGPDRETQSPDVQSVPHGDGPMSSTDKR